MNVSIYDQMQQMAAAMLTTTSKSGSANTDQSDTFQDMMSKVGKTDSASDASGDTGTSEKPAQDAKTTESTTQDKPVAQKPEKDDAAKSQELNGDPNAMQYAVDMFRPEIVDISQVEAAAEVTLEAEAVAEAAVAVEVMPEMDAEVPVEQLVEAPVVERTEAPVEDIQVPVQQEAAPEVIRQRTEDGPFQETVREPVKQEAERPQEVSQQPVQTGEAPETVEAVRVDNAPKTTNDQPEEESGEQPQEGAAQLNPQPVFHDVEAAPVKVAENYREIDTEAPDMDEQVAGAVWQGVEDGAQRIELKLNPANLGQVTIELTRDTSGLLQVALHVVSGRAENLLNQHLDGLQNALQAYSQSQQVKIEVQRNDETPQQQNQHQADPDGHNQNRQHQQRQEPRQEDHHDMDFLQKLRLGLLGDEEDA